MIMSRTEMNQEIAALLGLTPSNTNSAAEKAQSRGKADTQMALSLIFFSDVRPELDDRERYQLVRDLTRYGDEQGFEAVYLPERHFNEFGAIFPNAAVMAASLIPETRHIRFRTAGISLPLHHPAEVVEWWAMNDILSGGRVDLGFGSGWNKPDFIYAPDNYARRKEQLTEQIETVKRLWRGETLSFAGPEGEMFSVSVFPRPLQKTLTVWMLVAQNDRGFIEAGKQGYHLFTMLYGNDLSVLADKIALYRQARDEAGLDPAAGRVTLMLHTLIGASKSWVHKAVETPFKAYIKSTLAGHLQAQNRNHFDAAANQQILDYAWQRYFEKGALFGSVADGRNMLDQAVAAGVNEVACLMDFGVDHTLIHQSLPYLSQLKYHYV